MIDITKIESNFLHKLEEIDQMNKLGDDVIGLVLDYLNDLKEQNKELSGFVPYKQKLDNTIDQIKNFKDNPILQNKYQVIFNQSIVLIVSSFEVFINELIVRIANDLPQIISWDEKEKISINPLDCNYSQLNFGKIVLKHIKQKFSFQDIQSVLKMLSSYFSIEIKPENLDDLILYQASRNIIVHNLAEVDPEFLIQIKKTKYHDKYSAHSGGKLILKKINYNQAKKVYKELAEKILSEIKALISEKYGEEIIV